jgi:PKD repeat protein
MIFFDWSDGTLDGWTAVGNVTIIDSSIFGKKTIQCSSQSWTNPAYIYLTDSHTTGTWEIETAHTWFYPLTKIGILSDNTEANGGVWNSENELYAIYYHYGQWLEIGDSVNNSPEMAAIDYGYYVNDSTPFTYGISRQHDGTTDLLLNGISVATLSIPDDQLPNGMRIVIGAWDSGNIEINSFRFTPLGIEEPIPKVYATAQGKKIKDNIFRSPKAQADAQIKIIRTNQTNILKTSAIAQVENPTFRFRTDTYLTKALAIAEVNPITMSSAGPMADFTSDITGGNIPLTVQFTDLSRNGAIIWAWDFGDGTTSTEQNPVHTYTMPGIYTVKLKVTDIYCLHNTNIKAAYILASPLPPLASFISDDSQLDPSLTIHFTDTSKNNPDMWYWYFGDDSAQVTGIQNPTHDYAHTGDYQVDLYASNSAGYGIFSKTIHVKAPYVPPVITHAPVASFDASTNYGEDPLDVYFTDTSINYPDIWYWNFGDGTNSTKQNPMHTYFNEGIYHVTLRASNSRGSDTTQALIITVTPSPLIHISDNLIYYCYKGESDG